VGLEPLQLAAEEVGVVLEDRDERAHGFCSFWLGMANNALLATPRLITGSSPADSGPRTAAR
jgi:hypothetical protein